MSAASTDACGITARLASPAVVDCSHLGTTSVVITLSDAALNSSTCTATLTVEDLIPPSLTVNPDPLSVPLGGPYDETIGVVATDNCGVPAVAYTGDVVDVGTSATYNVIITATDGSGNTDVYNRSVVVTNALTVSPPSIVIGQSPLYADDAPITIECLVGGGTPQYTVEWLLGGVSQGSSPLAVAGPVQIVADPVALGGAGTYTYALHVTDSATGDETSTNLDVVVVDHLMVTAPTPVGIAETTAQDVIASVSGGMGALTYQWLKDDGTGTYVALTDVAGEYAGTATATLQFLAFVEATQAGNYRLDVSDDNETISSNIVVVTGITGTPVAGAFGVAALSMLSALGGALALRRRKK